MPRILIAGRGFIARAVATALGPDEVRVVAHDAVDPASFDGIQVALWGGRHPALGKPEWRLEEDPEPDFAHLCADRKVHLVTLGTRKVYGSSPDALCEDHPVAPWDRYGEHKAALEERLATLCRESLTRLRLANVFGFEPGRTSFMGGMIDGLLRDRTIRLDMSPFTRRDFLPVATAAACIAALLRQPPGGIVNVGSGIALECGRLALALIEGFGTGRLVVDDWRDRDGFVLDVSRLRALVPSDPLDCFAEVREVGRQLRVSHQS